MPTSNPSGERRRVTVWPQGSFLFLTRIRYPCDSRSAVAFSTGFGMKVPATLLFEENAESFAVEFSTCGRLANYWTETCDKQNLYLSRNLHVSLPPENQSHGFAWQCQRDHPHQQRLSAFRLEY